MTPRTTFALCLLTTAAWLSVALAVPPRGVLADGNAVAEVPAQTSAPPPEGADPKLHGDGRPVAGVEVHLRVMHGDKAKASEAIARALKEIRRLSRKLRADTRHSEVQSINGAAHREQVLLSRETYDLVQQALTLCRKTGRAYDPTVRSFDYLWNFRRRPPVRPLPDEIAARLANTGCERVLLKPNLGIRLNGARMRITLDDLLHGHAMNRVTQLLQESGIRSFRLRMGRDVYARGRVGTRHWYVAVRHPTKRDRDIVQLYLSSHAAATRSWSDRFFIKDGKRYHDVLDPRTGVPAEGVAQATVISTDTVMADALSSAVFVLGPRKGIALLDKLPQAEGFLIDAKGKVYASRGMSSYARLPARIDL